MGISYLSESSRSLRPRRRFDQEILACLQHIKPTNGEYYVTDALNIYVGELGKDMAVVTTKGEYLDCGTVDGWLHANQYMAKHQQ